MKLPERTTLLQLIKFGIVGVSNTGISLLVYYLFLWVDAGLYLLGNVAGWIVSVANAYYWNNKYVFFSRTTDWKRTLQKLGKTYLSYGATFLLSTALLYLEVDVLGWSKVFCPIVNLLITIPLNFLLNKFWTFR